MSPVSKQRGFAVFSEVFYSGGWKAFIDGAEAPIIRTDYAATGFVGSRRKASDPVHFPPAAYFTGQLVRESGWESSCVLLLARSRSSLGVEKKKAVA